MEITIKPIQDVSVVEISGDLDGSTAPVAQTQILPLAQQGRKVILDMTHVAYMSSAGLRLLLQTYRTVSAKGGRIALVGLSEELRDTMSLTGFLDFFQTYDTLDTALPTLTG